MQNEWPIIAAQAVPVPMDPAIFTTYGPLGLMVGVCLWWIAQQNARIESLNARLDKRELEHKTELAAERSLNAQLQEKRIEDHRVLVPLSHSMTTALERQLDHATRSEK